MFILLGRPPALIRLPGSLNVMKTQTCTLSGSAASKRGLVAFFLGSRLGWEGGILLWLVSLVGGWFVSQSGVVTKHCEVATESHVISFDSLEFA